MSTAAMTPNRLTVAFQYFRLGPRGEEELVAEGEQEIACMRRTDDRMDPAPLPQALRDAVEFYMKPAAVSATDLAVTL
jgi:enediyne core biosynthesis thioesterase